MPAAQERRKPSITRKKYPPGPRDGLLGIMFIGPMQAAPLTFAADVARRYGDFTFVRIGWVRLYFINRPELIREVLATKVKCFRKLARQMRALRKVEGNGLVASDGAPWAKHRPLVQGAFHTRHFAHYAQIIVEHTKRRMNGWSAGTALDVGAEMNQLALEIIAKLVFDVDWSDRARRLRDDMHIIRSSWQREVSRIVKPPDWLPLPRIIRQRRALRSIDNLIWDMIRERRASAVTKDDMLSLMLTMAAHGSGEPVSGREIRDEAATLFVAGHDTTSAALAWFWYLLARHPEVEQRVLAEVDAVLGDRTATYEDFGRLKYLEMVVKETMRLYPAAGFLFGREVVEDVEIGGYTLRKGAWVFVSPYIVHRDPNNFKEPEKFDPERFAPGRVESIPPYTYLPFGGGPRICVGNSMAMMEIVLLAATVLQRFRLALEQGQPEVESELEVVLRPKGELRMRVLQRQQQEIPVPVG